jgi:EAL domain-containing protein (putative c-di-GMP-specific phosphodiesterase class I)
VKTEAEMITKTIVAIIENRSIEMIISGIETQETKTVMIEMTITDMTIIGEM